MKLGFKLKKNVIFQNRVYNLNTNFRNVLRAMGALFDECADISETARVKFALSLLLKKFSRFRAITLNHAEKCELLSAVFDLLGGENISGNRESLKKSENLLSLDADADLIFSAFYSEYKIDLTQKNIDWRVFCALISGISQNTRLYGIMTVRASEIPDYNGQNQDEIDKIIKLKKSCAIKNKNKNLNDNLNNFNTELEKIFERFAKEET